MWIKKHGQLHKILYSISVCTHALCAHVNIIFANIYAHMYDVSSYVPTEPTTIHDISCDSFENPNANDANVVCETARLPCSALQVTTIIASSRWMECIQVHSVALLVSDVAGMVLWCHVMSCGTICTIWQEQIVSFKEQTSVDLHSALGICVSKCTFQGYLRIQNLPTFCTVFFLVDVFGRLRCSFRCDSLCVFDRRSEHVPRPGWCHCTQRGRGLAGSLVRCTCWFFFNPNMHIIHSVYTCTFIYTLSCV